MTPTSEDWIARVNRAMDLVLSQLDAPLDLHDVAKMVHSSPFHFHRVFRALVGETLHAFQKRVRLERALAAMAGAPDRRLIDIALEFGFSDASSFSRAFREHYGVSPRSFDLKTWTEVRREELGMVRLPPGDNPDGFEVRLRRLPARTFATLRVLDPYRPGRVTGAAARLMAWADGSGIEGRWFGWMWENPDLVPLTKCRYDVGVEVPPGTVVNGAVGLQRMPEMSVAELTIVGSIDLEMRGLDWLFGSWLPHSGLEPAALPSFEAWHGRPYAHGDTHFELDIQLPVEA